MTSNSIITSVVPWSSKKRLTFAGVLVSALFLIYNANLRLISTADSIPARFLPVSILVDHSLFLDRFAEFKHHAIWEREDGHLISYVPIATPLLATPIYALPLMILSFRHSNYYSARFYWLLGLLEKISASVITALSALFIFLVLLELSPPFIALLLSLTYGLCTSAWTISSQALWQHGPSMLLISIGLYTAVKIKHNKRYIHSLLISAALLCTIRPSNILFSIALLYVAYKSHPRYLVFSTIYFGLIIGLLMIYNIYIFGDVLGPYSRGIVSSLLHPTITHYNPPAGIHRLVHNPLGLRLPGILISPSRGLFVYSPFLIFGFIGLLATWRPVTNSFPHRSLFKAVLLAIVIWLLLATFFPYWWGGYCYGPRLLSELVPGLIMGIPLGLFYFKNKIYNIVFCLLAVWGGVVQGIGAFYYPNGSWDGVPVSVDIAPQRIWNWRDNQILRSLRAGPAGPTLIWTLSPPQRLPPEGYRMILDHPMFPTAMRSGHLYRGSIKITNPSQSLWPSYPDPFGLHVVRASYHWRDGSTGSIVVYDGWRTSLPKNLPPGCSVTLIMKIEPPLKGGRYLLEISLVQEGDSWFEDQGAHTLKLPVTVID